MINAGGKAANAFKANASAEKTSQALFSEVLGRQELGKSEPNHNLPFRFGKPFVVRILQNISNLGFRFRRKTAGETEEN